MPAQYIFFILSVTALKYIHVPCRRRVPLFLKQNKRTNLMLLWLLFLSKQQMIALARQVKNLQNKTTNVVRQ